jgi:spore maturation protein CgeB
MRILLFGKTRNVARLVEDPAEDLRLAGHTVEVFPYRDTKLKKTFEPLLLSPRLGVPLATLLQRRIDRFRPDLIVAFGPFHWLPPTIFRRLRNRPPMVAWIGDLFGPDMAESAASFDLVAYTDTGMLDLHKRFGFASAGAYLPLAATRGAVATGNAKPVNRLAFVASATPHRRALLAEVAEPIVLFGPDWPKAPELAHHARYGRKIGGSELAEIYRGHIGALNIRHEHNVINGLNQRHFAPYIVGTPVVADAQGDIEPCFEPGREIFVYRDAAELGAIQVELRDDPEKARAVGLEGQRRVLAHHTYAHRIEAIATLAGVGRRP